MAYDGSVLIKVGADTAKAEQQIAKLKDNIYKMEKELNESTNEKTGLEEQFANIIKTARVARTELKKLLAERDRLQGIIDASFSGNADSASAASAMEAYSKLDALNKEIAAQEKVVAATAKQEASAEKIAQKIDKITSHIEETENKISEAQTAAGKLQQQVDYANSAAGKMERNMLEVGKQTAKFSNRVAGLAKRVLVFSVITAGLQKVREWLWNVIQSNEDATMAMGELKSSLAELAYPLLKVVIPTFVFFANVLSLLISMVSSFFSLLFGASDTADALNNEADAINAVGGAAKSASKQLAGFDTINRLTSAGGGGGGGGLSKSLTKLAELPKFLKDILLKIRKIKFELASGAAVKSKDAWAVFLSGALGAILGGMFGGIYGAAIGLILGLSIGVIAVTFLDKMKNPEGAKRIFLTVLTTILGGIIGSIFAPPVGTAIGLLLGFSIGIIATEFMDADPKTTSEKEGFTRTLISIAGGIIGAVFGGITFGPVGAGVGGVIGLVFGLAISVLSTTFVDNMGGAGKAAAGEIFKDVLFAILTGIFALALGAAPILAITAGAIVLGMELIINVTKTSTNVSKKMISGAASGVTRQLENNISAQVETYGAGVSVKTIPKLAQGAVIPPNQQFLAVLGDQKSGTNIEAPLSTIKQAVLEAMAQNGGGNKTVVLQVDGREFASIVFDMFNLESQRLGVKAE